MSKLNDLISSKTKEIDTPSLTIKGNIIECRNLIIQMSNVSTFEAVNAPKEPFPLWSIFVILVGLSLCANRSVLPIGLGVLIVSGFIIYLWYKKNEETKRHKYLCIKLNNTEVIRILFTDLNFLQKVLDCIKEILTNPDNKQEFHINIQGNTINGGSAVDSLNIR